MKRPIILLLLLLLLSLAGFLAPDARAVNIKDGDWQFWNTNEISLKVADKTKAVIEEEWRLGEGMGSLYYQHLQGGLEREVAGWLSVFAGYRDTFSRSKDSWQHTWMPNGHANMKLNWKGFDLLGRSRFEYLIPQSTRDYWRYRQRVILKLPVMVDRWKVRPWTCDEVFVVMTPDDFNENRLSGGIEFKPLSWLTCDLYYMWKTDKSAAGWVDRNVFGTKAKFSF